MPEPIYTPSGIIDIYNNSVNIPQERNVISVKGIYYRGTDQLYANQFYDSLTDEMGGTKITIKTSQLQRNKLANGKLATVLGVLNRKIRTDSTIAVSINVTDILVVEEKKITDEERKRADIQLKKINIGYKIPEQIIKQKLYKGEKANVALIFASGTIVQPEFENALTYASEFISFSRNNIAFSNSTNVVNFIHDLDLKFDVIALIRGGGMDSGLDFFDSTEFNSGILQIKSCLISAIGHNPEKFFFKNIADKVIDTPTALGFFFKNLVDDVKSEINNSKAILTEQVKQQFQNQIKTINEQNEKLNSQIKLNTENTNKLIEQINKTSTELNATNIKLNTANSLNSNLQREISNNKSSKTFFVILVIILSLVSIFLLFK